MSTYSTRLKVELIGSGEQSNSWGNTTNNNFDQVFEQSIAGVYSKNLGAASSPYTLTSGNGPQTQANNEARQAAIVFTGHSSDFIIQFPAVEKLYFLRNASASNKITARLGSSGNTFVLNPSRNVFLTTDGTNWFELQTQGSDWLTKTGTYTAFAGDKIFVNTSSSAFTITLPASPSVGDEVRFLDLANTFDTNNLTVARNSEKIDGVTADLTVATEGAAFALVYSGSTYGWKLLEK
tara:strand:- start:839 stop:1549 length:711 start_codon:yes stop_codon:yes gene_type:complete